MTENWLEYTTMASDYEEEMDVQSGRFRHRPKVLGQAREEWRPGPAPSAFVQEAQRATALWRKFRTTNGINQYGTHPMWPLSLGEFRFDWIDGKGVMYKDTVVEPDLFAQVSTRVKLTAADMERAMSGHPVQGDVEGRDLAAVAEHANNLLSSLVHYQRGGEAEVEDLMRLTLALVAAKKLGRTDR
jgi:hypothetical protein